MECWPSWPRASVAWSSRQVPALDWTLVERERPAVVLTFMTERFLVDVPDDATAMPVDALAAAKLAEGRLRPWRMERWSGERHVSPAEVERVRARMLADGRRRDAAMVSTLAYAGLRPHELLTMRWRQLKPEILRVPTASEDPAVPRRRSRRTAAETAAARPRRISGGRRPSRRETWT